MAQNGWLLLLLLWAQLEELFPWIFCCLDYTCSKAQLTETQFSLPTVMFLPPCHADCLWDIINAFCSCHSAGNWRWALIHPCVSVLRTLLFLSVRLGWQALPKEYALDGHTDINEAFPSPMMTVQANQSDLQGSRIRGQLCPHGDWQEEDILPWNVQTRYLSSLPHVWLQWPCTSLFSCWCSL